jgi:hypothetical protein
LLGRGAVEVGQHQHAVPPSTRRSAALACGSNASGSPSNGTSKASQASGKLAQQARGDRQQGAADAFVGDEEDADGHDRKLTDGDDGAEA